MRNDMLCALSTCVFIAILSISPLKSSADQPVSDGHPDQVVLQPYQRPQARSADGADTTYLSPAVEAAHPFTHILVRRDAAIPEGATLALRVRASIDGVQWSNWVDLISDDDLWIESDGPNVAWSQTIDVGALAHFWQIQGSFTAARNGVLPELRRLDINTVDTSIFPAAKTAFPQDLPEAATTTLAFNRPPIVSRTSWGNPDGEGSRVAPAYYPVTHLVVHNTADRSTLYPTEPNWAARVRAIWAFHTFTRGWGDIGYNYLIDPNGVIYEGRAGGDNAVGFHDTANYGSIGISMIGDYTMVAPSAATQAALVSMLAWKAAQKNIDPFGSGYYEGCARSIYCAPFNPNAILPNIVGHRQVTPGHTIDPGDIVIGLLPRLRDQVKELITESTDNQLALEVGEESTGFSRSLANWYDAACGGNGHAYYTYATDTQEESTNSATWRPMLVNAGVYHLYARIPQRCGLATGTYASQQAHYRITYAGGVAMEVVDQNTAIEWVDLGLYPFEPGDAGAVTLDDLTGEPFSARRVLFFDAIKWVPEQHWGELTIQRYIPFITH